MRRRSGSRRRVPAVWADGLSAGSGAGARGWLQVPPRMCVYCFLCFLLQSIAEDAGIDIIFSKIFLIQKGGNFLKII